MRGSVIKRGKGWSIVYRTPDPATGKMKQVWRGGFDRKIDAERALREIVGQIDEGTYVAPTRQTVQQYFVEDWFPSLEALVAGGKMRPSTANSYRTQAELHVLPNIGGVYLRALDAPRLNKLYGQLLRSGRKDGKGGLSPTTVHLVHVTISRALKDAIRWGKLSRNVAADAEAAPQPERHEMVVWPREQLAQFLTHVATDRLFAMWLAFATTGLRRGEMAGLRWSDLDLDVGEMSVRVARVVVDYKVHDSGPKTEKGKRTIALDVATVAALKAHRKTQLEEHMAWGPAWVDTGLVFVREDGTGYHPERFSQMFKRQAARASLPPLPLHGLRHSYATAALMAGVAIRVVQERLGHASHAITADLYTHVLPSTDRQAADDVASFILGTE